MGVTAKQKKAAEEFAADERYRAALKRAVTEADMEYLRNMKRAVTEADMEYLRNINTSPGSGAGRSIDPTKPGPAEEFAADERYRAALKYISEFAEFCGQQQANITTGLERLEQALKEKKE